MPWYVASLIARRKTEVTACLLTEIHCLLAAADDDSAYGRCPELGAEAARRIGVEAGRPELTYLGIADLLETINADPPKHGSEILWASEELTLSATHGRLRHEQELAAYCAGAPSPTIQARPTGWFIAESVLMEIHETGTHGDAN